MDVIKILPPQEVQKIAAGEVVDRPTNIVKELIENALDAGSSKIDISILDGGKKMIQINDNGCGMTPNDVRTSIVRHATSKIAAIEDLDALNTFGFRGEALASISAVSYIEIISKHDSSQEGIKLCISGGTIQSEEPCAWTTGTRITIENLFFNIPARQKFLRPSATETRLICQLFQALALAHHKVQFSLFSEKKLVYQCGKAQSALERYLQFSSGFQKNNFFTIEETELRGIKIQGFVANHHVSRYDKNHIFFFVNRRLIKNYKLTNALMRGYQNVLPSGKYPVATLFIEIDQHEIDVNIHPRKEEVAFVHPQRVENLIAQVTKKALEQSLSHASHPISYAEKNDTIYLQKPFVQPWQKPLTLQQNYKPVNESLEIKQVPPIQREFMPEHIATINPGNNNEVIDYGEQTTANSTERNETLIKKERNYYLLGQLSSTYILIGRATELMIIDAHAAHERILYEQFAHKFKKQESVGLLFPSILELNQIDIEILMSHEEILQEMGLFIESFGPQKIMITATPAGLQNINYLDLFKQIVSFTYENDTTIEKERTQQLLINKVHALMACKAAVKAGDKLSNEQMYHLADELFTTPNRLTCPHGRPTIWNIHYQDIEKKFKRRL